MKRREFVAATCLAGLAPLGKIARAQAAGAAPAKQYLELRLYHLDSVPKQESLIEFFRAAAIPALNRLGIAPVGVFQFLKGETSNLYVLLPHNSAGSVVTAPRLMADAEYRKAGAAVLESPTADPAFTRIESTLMLAFDGVPKVRTPAKGKSRVFQLRTYESHNAERARKKIEMFNTGGELEIFARTGLPVVFFGETLIGTKMPNLTYMLGFDDMEASKKGWEKFMADPQWKKLRADPAYKDTVSGITNIYLRPASCSQI
ncbi:MAG: NIPSNAP family protein [Planctomycetota bacterium]|jgi:hypothetical protein